MSAQSAAVTSDSVDPAYNDPYIEVRELRSEPVPHLYVRGGFKGTDARFSFYFPPKEKYEGRFFHNTYPLAMSSDIGPFPIQFDVAVGDLGFTIDSGAYYVQTNLGGADRAGFADPAIAAYRVNAAAAKYSRVLAQELYGAHRTYGYLFGGSGGSYQTIGAAEHTEGVWDGFVPYVLGCTNAIPSMFTVRKHALRVLRQRNKFPEIMDAVNPGGSGDPYATLNEEEAAALKEVTLLGFPPRGWYAHEKMDGGYFYTVAFLPSMMDASYVDDFWSKPGYLGADPNNSIHAARIAFDTKVASVTPGEAPRIEVESVPTQDYEAAHIHVLSGASAGKSFALAATFGKTLTFPPVADLPSINAIQPGDQIRIDNSWPLALQTYQRHQVPTPDLYAWDQYRDAKGEPLYPQRGMLVGAMGAMGSAGGPITGAIRGKVLLLQCLMDIDALAWQADWYKGRVQAQLGDKFDDTFALYFIDHAQHDNPLNPLAHAHAVSFSGALQQALRDLALWVEKGVHPSNTQYRVKDAQVLVPENAKERAGIQATVQLSVRGGARADVKAGAGVAFDAVIETPPGAGKIVSAEWDFEGVGTYPVRASFTPAERVTLSASHAFATPGTYFPVIRIASQREGNASTPYARVENLARVRVVVS